MGCFFSTHILIPGCVTDDSYVAGSHTSNNYMSDITDHSDIDAYDDMYTN